MMVSVNVDFLKMAVLKPVGVLCMDRSRNLVCSCLLSLL